MARYEDASVRAYTSLAVLNAGQAVIFTIGLAAVMVMCAFEIKSGSKTVGDFVLINAMMIQLYQPLNFMGDGLSRDANRRSPISRSCLRSLRGIPRSKTWRTRRN
jgi:ABC-type transport system involved in Fe-S cluster assembly fused permease/ATPase subunit